MILSKECNIADYQVFILSLKFYIFAEHNVLSFILMQRNGSLGSSCCMLFQV